MLCVPAVRAVVAHCAVRVLPLPARATAEQPLIELAPSLKLTLPVGLEPVTDAVRVTFAPTVEGFNEEASVVLLPAPLTTCESALLVEPVLLALPLPARATAEQPLIELAPSLKLTLPVGLEPVADAVRVTFAPTVEGFDEEASVVLLP